jgi:hypothetical protein
LSGAARLIVVGIVLSLFDIISCGGGMYFILPIPIAGYAGGFQTDYPALSAEREFDPPTPDYYRGIKLIYECKFYKS